MMMPVSRGVSSLGASSLVTSIANAISNMEGFTSGASGPAVRNNNPGNLMYAGQAGAIGADAQGFAIFPSVAAGTQALDNQVQANINRGLTLQQFFCGGNGYGGYAPDAGGNNCNNYANYVAGQTGISASTPLTSVDTSLTGDSSSVDLSTVDLGDDTGLFGLDSNTTMLLGVGIAAIAATFLLTRA